MKSSISSPSVKPKVIIVGPSFTGGGAERRFANIVKNLFSGKCDVAVLVPSQAPEIGLGKVFYLGWSKSSRLSYIKAIWILRQWINQGQYDVLMSFGLFPNLVSIIAGLLASFKTKVIINEITRPKLLVKQKNLRSILYRELQKWFYGRSFLITANSIDGLREACELGGVVVERGFRVPNVIDHEHLNSNYLEHKRKLEKNGNSIICLGRLDFMKRIDTVVYALHRLIDRINCNLFVVGDGEARPALEAQVVRLGLTKSVIFTGKLENPFPFLREASVFVLASEYEGYSNSVLEAMFCDVPVITSFCSSDAREMCEQGAALGFEVGDVEQLAEHIAAIIGDQALSQKLICRAREYRAPHALENAIPVYENLIRRVAGYEEFSG